MREKLIAFFSAGYFTVDLIYVLRSSSYTYALHHLIAMTLIYGAITTVEFQRAQCTSLILLTELSTPLLWIWEEYRTKATHAAFLAVFFIARPVLLSYVLYYAFFDPEFLRMPVGPFHATLTLLNVLNFGYFVQQLIALCGATKEKAA